MSKIAGIGHALIDIFVNLDDEGLLKKYGFAKGSQEHVDQSVFDSIYQELNTESARFVPGGSASNVLHPLASMGYEATFLGALGHDEWASLFEQDLQQAGVSFAPVRKEGATGRVLHLITPDGEKTVVGYTGVNEQLTKADLDEWDLSDHTHLVVDGFLAPREDFLEDFLQREDLQQAQVLFDMASSHIAEGYREFLKRLLKTHVDMVFANDLEAFSYTGNEPERGIRSIAKDCEVVVIKQGEKGALIQRGNEFYTIAAAPSGPHDTTGAGDLYMAGFLYGWLKNYHLTHCGKVASFVASKILEVEGARLSVQQWKEIQQMI